MGRKPCCEKVGLKRGRWTAEEDAILTKYIQANGEGSWRSLPKNAGLLRCGKSCRLRWINYLRSDLKRGNITSEEEDVIIKLRTSLGNRWSMIADHLPGRTDNEIKNYWNTHLSRKIQSCRKPTTTETLPQSSLDLTLLSRKRPSMKQKNSYNNSSKNPTNIVGVTKNHKEDHDVSYNNSSSPSMNLAEEDQKEDHDVMIQMPCTPTLENEAILSGKMKIPRQRIDTGSPILLLGQPCETEEVIEPSPSCQDHRGETENLVLNHCEERANTSSGIFIVGHGTEDDQELDDLLDTCQGLDVETLCLGDIFGEGFFDDSDGVAFTVGEERENNINANNIVISHEKRENGTNNSTYIGSGNLSSSGELSSTTYSPSTCIDLEYWNLNWDAVFQGHDHNNQLLVEEEKMMSWLWESDNINVEEDCNDQEGEKPEGDKQEAIAMAKY